MFSIGTVRNGYKAEFDIFMSWKMLWSWSYQKTVIKKLVPKCLSNIFVNHLVLVALHYPHYNVCVCKCVCVYIVTSLHHFTSLYDGDSCRNIFFYCNFPQPIINTYLFLKLLLQEFEYVCHWVSHIANSDIFY